MDRQQWNERYAAQPILWDVDPDPFLGVELAGCGQAGPWTSARARGGPRCGWPSGAGM